MFFIFLLIVCFGDFFGFFGCFFGFRGSIFTCIFRHFRKNGYADGSVVIGKFCGIIQKIVYDLIHRILVGKHIGMAVLRLQMKFDIFGEQLFLKGNDDKTHHFAYIEHTFIQLQGTRFDF